MRRLLPIYTFVAIFLVIVAVGLVTVPVVLRLVEKIKTIGDSYMVCGNLPEPDPAHLENLAAIALDMMTTIRRLPAAERVQLRLLEKITNP